MMRGVTIGRRATLPVTFRLPGQPNITLEFIVDTGFTEFLTLPPAAVAAMQLPYLYTQGASLADATAIRLSVHGAIILWNGIEREVRVVATGRRPLLGTGMLDDQELRAQFRESGLVSVEEL